MILSTIVLNTLTDVPFYCLFDIVVTWIAPYNPRHSTFVPVYASATKAPTSLSTGTLCKSFILSNNNIMFYIDAVSCVLVKADRVSNFWVHSVCSNYLSRVYKYSIGDIMDHQANLEDRIYRSTTDAENKAIDYLHRRSPGTVTPDPALQTVTRNIQNDDEPRMMPVLPPGGDPNGPQPQVKGNSIGIVNNTSTIPDPALVVSQWLTEYSDQLAADVREKWWDFFFHIVGVYRDTYKIVSPHVEVFTQAYEYTGVPRYVCVHFQPRNIYLLHFS